MFRCIVGQVIFLITLYIFHCGLLSNIVLGENTSPCSTDGDTSKGGRMKRQVIVHANQHRSFNAFTSWQPFIVLAVVWFVLLVTLSTAYWVAKSREERKVGHIYDGCTNSSVNYKYIMQLTFGKHSRDFSTEKAFVMLDLLDRKKMFITRIAIPPQWMSPKWTTTIKAPQNVKVKSAKFQLNRGVVMKDIGFVRIAHDCHRPINQYLQIYNLEIKDLMANLVTLVPINRAITNITPDMGSEYQVYEAQPPSVAKRDGDLYVEGITPNIEVVEYVAFVAFFINACMLFLLTIPNYFELQSFGAIIANGILSTLLSLIFTTVPVVSYQFGIKRNYAKNHGTGAWNLVRLTFLVVMFLFALSIGVAASILASGVKQPFDVYWTTSILIPTVVLFFIIIPGIYVLHLVLTGALFSRTNKQLGVIKDSSPGLIYKPSSQLDNLTSVMSTLPSASDSKKKGLKTRHKSGFKLNVMSKSPESKGENLKANSKSNSKVPNDEGLKLNAKDRKSKPGSNMSLQSKKSLNEQKVTPLSPPKSVKLR